MAADLQIAFDCSDPIRLAAFWAAALGYIVQPPPDGYERWEDFLSEAGIPQEQWGDRYAIVDPEGKGPRVFFQRVPEGKTAKNRVHLDVSVATREVGGEERAARLQAEAQRLVDQGATLVRSYEEMGERWITLLDPEGNEFDLQ